MSFDAIRPPRGRNVRKGLVQTCLAVGTVYAFFSSTMPAAALTYQRQAELMPLPYFGCLLYALAILLWATRNVRSRFVGRFVAGIAAVLFYTFSVTFIPYGLSGVAMYAIVAFWATGEAFFLTDGC